MSRKIILHGFLGYLISAILILGACDVIEAGESKKPPTSLEVSYTDLFLDLTSLADIVSPKIPGCSLADLRPFGWKEVNSGLVDIRTPEEYATRIESLYQEGYLDYLQTRGADPDKYQSVSEMSYKEFFAACNVFPEVDFGRYSVLGAQATGTGCTVTFEKHVFRDEQNKKIIYSVAVVEEGKCEMTSHHRNLILVSRIPHEYSVDFRIKTTPHD